MHNYVVWLDSETAHIFCLKSDGIEKFLLKKSGLDHHSRNKKNHFHDSNEEHYFRDLSLKLQDASQLLILGPGLTKNHFKTHLETHHTGGLAEKIIGLEASDHPTDNQILATARKYYAKYDLYERPITTS